MFINQSSGPIEANILVNINRTDVSPPNANHSDDSLVLNIVARGYNNCPLICFLLVGICFNDFILAQDPLHRAQCLFSRETV